MESYRLEVQATMSIALRDANAELDPAEASGGASTLESEIDRLRI